MSSSAVLSNGHEVDESAHASARFRMLYRLLHNCQIPSQSVVTCRVRRLGSGIRSNESLLGAMSVKPSLLGVETAGSLAMCSSALAAARTGTVTEP